MKSSEGLLDSVAALGSWPLALVRELVTSESPSDSPEAVNAAVALVRASAEELGGRSTIHSHDSLRQAGFGNPQFGDALHGDALEVCFGPEHSAHRPILLLGHLDTVWPLGTIQAMPWREADGRIYGPGILDMKAGVVMALAAVRVLTKLGLLQRPVTLLLNPDEEVGSPVSRTLTERLAQQSEAVLVLEPAQGLACKTSRKGVGDYRLEVTGVAAHAGVDFEHGHSAILELAHLLDKVAAFTDLRIGRTVSPGVIGGGTRSNVVAAHAWAEVDVRIAAAADGPAVDQLFRTLRCQDPACSLTVTGGLNRPPMERKPGTVRLYTLARRLASELGFDLPEAATGGGSDGNFTAALGVPTLDGLGAVGEGAHAAHEHIVLEHLIPRTALLAGLVAAL